MNNESASTSGPVESSSLRFYRGTRADLKPGDLFYHGTRANLKPGDLLGPGYLSNYGTGKKANHIYFSALLEPAVWGAELAQAEGRGRIYVVEPTGPFVDDPNLTDKKFPGNPTRSYRSKEPVRIAAEITEWQGHSPEQLKVMKDNLARLKQQGLATIDD
jgi:rifampin ADP-ribosylating transferase